MKEIISKIILTSGSLSLFLFSFTCFPLSCMEGEKPSHVLFQDGLLQRFGIEGMVFELNANWIGSLNKMPSESDWMEFGKNLNEVFYKYMKAKH